MRLMIDFIEIFCAVIPSCTNLGSDILRNNLVESRFRKHSVFLVRPIMRSMGQNPGNLPKETQTISPKELRPFRNKMGDPPGRPVLIP